MASPNHTLLDSRLLAYLLPLLAGAVMCALTWPLQQDRIAYDEVREGLRAFGLARGASPHCRRWLARASTRSSTAASKT